MKHVTPSMIVSVVLSLLVVLWVKMTLNSMHPQAATAEQPPKKKKGKELKEERDDDACNDLELPKVSRPNVEEVMPQPPPTQPRPTMHWEPHMPPPLTVGRTLIQVEPDPMVEDDGAFEHGE